MFNRDVILGAVKLAAKYNAPVAGVLGVAQTESAGSVGTQLTITDYKGNKVSGLLPIIRYEGHKADEYLVKKGDQALLKKARAAGLSDPKRGVIKNPKGQKDRYEKLLMAMMRLDPMAGIYATGWGLGQVQGFNAVDLGYSSMMDFYNQMMTGGVIAQIEAMLKFCKRNNIIRHMISKRYDLFASVYNGPAYAENSYDVNMQRNVKNWEDYIAAHPEILGVAPPATLVSAPTSGKNMQTGSSGPAVKALQQNLVLIAFAKYQDNQDWFQILAKVELDDGKFGPATAMAVSTYQKLRGETVDSIAGTDTLAAIQKDVDAIKATPDYARLSASVTNHFLIRKTERATYEQSLLAARKSGVDVVPAPPAKNALAGLVQAADAKMDTTDNVAVVDPGTTDGKPDVAATLTNLPPTTWDRVIGAVAKPFLAIGAVLLAALNFIWETVKDIWHWTIDHIYMFLVFIYHLF